MTVKYHIDLPAFSGPLDLLLHLIERQELDITAISLAMVADQYLAQIDKLPGEKTSQLIDFLVIGARLALIKSRALLPEMPPALSGDSDEEDPAEALTRQLRRYKRYRTVAIWLERREAKGLRTYLRVAPAPQLETRLDLTGITLASLSAAFEAALERTGRLKESIDVAVERRTFTVQGQMQRLRDRLSESDPYYFADILSSSVTPTELAVTLLALLELIKRCEVTVFQPGLFEPIEVLAGKGSVAGERDDHASRSEQATATSR